jgi:N-acyl-D-aspartate/D-glutamate deacylase
MARRLAIRGGIVHDGTGAEPRAADVLVEAGRIVAVGALDDVDGEALDASGCIVAPGFVDVHSHSDYTLLVDPRAVSSIHQGVTTEVIGNCGFGCFPIVDPQVAAAGIYGYRDDHPVDWRTAAEYLERLEAAGPAVNVATLVPNGQLRRAAMAHPSQVAGPEEVTDMARLLTEALDAGAWGYSTGLEYAVEERAGEREVAELCRVAARMDALYATHTRGRGGDGVDGVAEALRTAQTAGVRLQISHLLPRGGQAGGERCIAAVDAAIAAGQDVMFDQHTRPHGFTYLLAALPPGALDGGPGALARRLDDPAERAAMRGYRGILGDDFSRVVLLDNRRWPDYARRDLMEIAAERGQEPIDAVLDLLAGAVDDLHDLTVILPAYTPQQQREAFAHPCCMPASDATALAPDGPLAASAFHGAYTWAAWYWRAMVREARALTAAQAIRRLTALPAQRLGLRDRGRLAEGLRADVAVFDPDVFAERGTTFAPNRLAVGMRHVLVNGLVTLRDGAATGARGGEVLRRT